MDKIFFTKLFKYNLWRHNMINKAITKTPIYYENSNAHRFSIVYYSLKQMWKCLEIDDEILWARKTKTAREIKRYEPYFDTVTDERIESIYKGFKKIVINLGF